MPSTFTLGVGSSLYDRAERYAIVRGVTNNQNHQALTEAIEFIVAQAGAFHHQKTTLPLQRVTAKKIGPRTVLVILEYFRRAVSGSIDPTLLARYRGATIGTTWYRTPVPNANFPTGFDNDGRPAGDLQFGWGGSKFLEWPAPKSWEWERPAVSIHLPFINLATNPIGVVADRLGNSNSQSYMISGISYQTNYLRFDSVTIDAIGQFGGGTPTYHGSYNFLTVKGGFVAQFAYYDTAASPYVWATSLVPAQPQSNFSSPNFPGIT